MEEVKREFIFNNEEFGELRTFIDQNGRLWIAGIDVARALGYKNPSNAVRNHCNKDRIVKRKLSSELSNGTYELSFIDSANFCRLVVKSKLPSAEKFEDWVVEEVLPSLRESRQYSKVEEKSAFQNNQNSLEEINKALVNKVNYLTNQNQLLAEELTKCRLYSLDEIAKEFGIRATTLEAMLEDKGYDLESIVYVKSGVKYVDSKGKGMVKKIVYGLFQDAKETLINLITSHFNP
nr:MAG TPA: repressor domain protein [Bacteriophage sp.]